MIYIFGGAFDPPHVGHTAIVKSILAKKHPEKIVIIPSSARNDKQYAVSDEHRLAMLRIFIDEINTSTSSVTLTKEESARLSGTSEQIPHTSEGQDQRVILDEYFIRNWNGEMITRDVDLYAREKYGEDIVHIFGTDTIESMPSWDSEGYAAKIAQKLFIPRGVKRVNLQGKSTRLEASYEGGWCRFSPGKGGVRGGYLEYENHLTEYARDNRKNSPEPEKKLWSILRGKTLKHKTHRQKPIGKYIVDFYLPSIQLVIEIDGESHVDALENDTSRTVYLNELGINVLRYTNSEVSKNLEGVYEDIISWIDRLEQTPPILPFSGEGIEHIENFEFFTDSHIPDISSTEIRKIIPEYTDLKALFEENPKYIIPGLSKRISRYILENRLYRGQDVSFLSSRRDPFQNQDGGRDNQNLLSEGKRDSSYRRNDKSGKPRVLVHVCCGPDATMPILQLRDEYDVVCFWYDPNIQPIEEHDKRYEAFVKVCEIEGIPYIKGAYDVKHFFTRIKGLEYTPEKGEKCTNCYDMRMYVSAKLAARLKIPYYTSSLNTSPKKDLEKLFVMGHKYAEKYGITFLDIPFRKRGGFEKSVEYTREHDIFRQNYCGCVYSIREGGESEMKRRMVG